ncbi:tetratricopeptide repeat protein [Micromonospora rifamycinica]|uniref:tetratricopeptide repeat protein n=1 Tax=Micromonospora rifamycinica TaxID=291594 RepID=UPI0034165B75
MNLPTRPRLFVGRDDALARLDAAVRDTGPVLVQAVHGLGGIGKSTLAARWAERHRDAFTPIWWITADSEAALDAGLVAFATALQPGLDKLLSSAALRERAVQWLASRDGWLLILDNVNDPAHIAEVLARLPRGRILVTSRRATGWPDTITALRLDVLSLREAVRLLTGILARAGVTADVVDLAAVCAELGCLPLAVEQAGAYLAQTGVTAAEYLGLLAEHPAQMYQEGEEGRAGQRTIARVWQVTLDALADDPLPGRLLKVLAWYAAPDPIPRDLLYHLDDQPAVVRAIGRLAAYNMITLNHAHHAVTVHRLVQAVARTPDASDPHRQPEDITDSRTRAIAALAAGLPDNWRDPATWPTWRSLLPHLNALVTYASNDPATGYLLNHAALFLADQGNLAEASRYFEQALIDCRRVLGDDHPNTLALVNNLATTYESAGDLQRAIPLYEQALIDCRRVLGDDYPDTLTSVNNLAAAYESAGDLQRATPLYEQALTDRRRVLGDDHPDTLTSVNNLACAYQTAGDLQRAIPLYQQALTDCRRILGDQHAVTRAVYGNLRVPVCQAEMRQPLR